MSLLQILVKCILSILTVLHNLLPRWNKRHIPTPPLLLRHLLDILYTDNNLLKLEYLTDFYSAYGLFQFDNKVYIFDHKITQTVINKLEKGASDYLEDSPLKDTILGSTNRSPEVRRAIAAIFRKSTLEEKGELVIEDAEKMCNRIEVESNEDLVLIELLREIGAGFLSSTNNMNVLLQRQLRYRHCPYIKVIEYRPRLKHRNNYVIDIFNTIWIKADRGDLVNITAWSLRFAMDVVGHMLLQLDLHALDGKQEQLLDALMTILHRCYALAEISASSEEFKAANEQLEQITTDILTDSLKREDTRMEKRLVEKLHEACGFDMARDNMKLFLMAGSETTASTIPVLIYLLSTYPDVQEELRQEADENIDALYKNQSLTLPKLEAVLKEVLRVYPIAPFISRQTRDTLTVGDITIPANSDIKAFTWGIHRSSSQWSKSKVFQPFRFLSGEEKISSKLYIPFGAGSRVCIGQHLALLELKIVTAILLHRFRFFKVPETRELRFVTDWAHAVIHPDKDLYFKVEVRK